MNKLNDFVLTNILPKNLLKDEFVKSLSESIDIQIKQLYKEVDNFSNLNDVDKLPEFLLDYLAYERHVDFYEYDGDIGKKRDLIKLSMKWHMHKGTKYAVEEIAATVFDTAKVVEWFDYGGDPYRFRVEIGSECSGRNKNNKKRLLALINTTKNTRSWLDGILIVLGEETILLIEKTYHYPVFFEYCNHVHGTSHMEYKADEINIENKTYDYPVRFFACEIKSMLFSDKEHIQEQSYQYPVIFGTCGEMNPINASFQEQKYDGDIRDETYMFLQKLNTCGEFVCE